MRAIIFDIDGTLLESTEVDERLYFQAVAAVLGRVPVRRALNAYRHVTDTGILREILEDNAVGYTRKLLDDVRSAFTSLVDEHIRRTGPFAEIAGAKALLARTRGDPETAVAIATGGWRATAVLKLSSAGFDIGSTPLVTSDDAHSRIEILRLASARLPGPCDSFLYVGDGPWDRAACEELGWAFHGVGPAVGGPRDLTEVDW